MQKEKLGITGLYIHCICSTATVQSIAERHFGASRRPNVKLSVSFNSLHYRHFTLHHIMYKGSTVAEMGDRLARIDMGRKVGAVVPLLGGGRELGLRLTQPGLRRSGLPPYQVVRN